MTDTQRNHVVTPADSHRNGDGRQDPEPDAPGTPETSGAPDTSGTLDEALERIHLAGPERDGWLSNHAPMAVEALVRRGQASAVHRWLDQYRSRLEDMPGSVEPVASGNWHEALGDIDRVGDWTVFFERETDSRPWRAVLAEWWPRLLPGIAGGATHGVIRVGHSVKTLVDDEETAPRVRELAHALGYWAARFQPLPPLERLAGPADAAGALDRVPLIAEQDGEMLARLGRLTAFPDWPGGLPRGRRRPVPHSRNSSRPPPTVTRPMGTPHRSCWSTRLPHPTRSCAPCPRSPTRCGCRACTRPGRRAPR